MPRTKGAKDKPETKRIRRTKAELNLLKKEPTKLVRVPISLMDKVKAFIKQLINN